MSATIEISNVGPVIEFEYEMAEPGLHVLCGDHGVGKSTVLRTIQLATDGRADGGKPTKADGAKRGEAAVAGKRILIGKSVREEGELELEGLGDLDLAGLHSPHYLDARTRDKHRIRALVRLAGVEADASLFHDLVGGKGLFDSIVDTAATETDDLVEMAAKVKRAIEKAAQGEERQAETARANLRAKADQYAGVDLDAPHDEAELQKALVHALEVRATIAQKREDGLAVKSRAEAARQKLAAAQTGAVSVEDAQAALTAAVEARCEAEERVAELSRQLDAAQNALRLAEAAESNASDALERSRQHAALTADWRADIEAAESVECPTAEDLESADRAVDAANAAATLGVKVRAAIEARRRADHYAAEAKEHEQAAAYYRKAAAATQDVLTDAISRIPNCPLKVWNDDDGNARLVLETERSEREPLDELSDGERYDVLIPMVARPGRLIVLSQAAFGELSPTLRERVDRIARERGCYVLTAQADDGELRGEPYRELAAAVA